MTYSQNSQLGRFLEDDKGVWHGYIAALGLASTSVISENATTSEGVDYKRMIADPLGNPYQFGVAFPKKSKSGRVYWVVTIDSPLFPAPIKAALFPVVGNETVLNLVYSRPVAEKPAVEATHRSDAKLVRRSVALTATP